MTVNRSDSKMMKFCQAERPLRGRKMGSRMFDMVGITWNPVTGCQHMCQYCWARKLAETRLKRNPRTKKYVDGFKPKIHEDEFNVRFPPGKVVFVSDMGDLFGSWVPSEWVHRVLEVVYRHPRTTFLFLTKNPIRYREFRFPLNCILGATIETNRDYGLSKAPPPRDRYIAMLNVGHPRKMVSIEPVMDFDYEELLHWIVDLKPEIVYIGYDKYHNNLPEPPKDKVLKLIEALKLHGVHVRNK